LWLYVPGFEQGPGRSLAVPGEQLDSLEVFARPFARLSRAMREHALRATYVGAAFGQNFMNAHNRSLLYAARDRPCGNTLLSDLPVCFAD
jgi:hypothetical protein